MPKTVLEMEIAEARQIGKGTLVRLFHRWEGLRDAAKGRVERLDEMGVWIDGPSELEKAKEKGRIAGYDDCASDLKALLGL